MIIIIRPGKPTNNRTSGDYPNYRITKIGHYTEKSSGDLGRLAATQIPVKNHQRTCK